MPECTGGAVRMRVSNAVHIHFTCARKPAPSVLHMDIATELSVACMCT